METDDQGRSDGPSPYVGTTRDDRPEALLGTVFASRYHLTRMLSAGANTVIFDADDVETRRPVTLKVVQPGLAVTPTFRDRFDSTIGGVAALSHPNIAAIFDWGSAVFGDEPTVYVVIERLTAGSVRDMYDRGRRLSPSQALAIGLEACRGLDHAHRRGFVHGELTPSKLVFGDDRRLRIVDFGLADLLGELQWQEPSSLSTHVARYASPEQALSLPVDGTTDVYALCLTLVEGVTGELPFSADSTVATLAARVGRLMPVSADLGPLAAVLERAGRPEAHERSTAAQFGRALVQAAEKLPRPEPLPLLSTGLFETPVEQLRSPDDPTGGVVRPAGGAGDDLVITLSDDDQEADVPATSTSEPASSEPATSEPATSEPPPGTGPAGAGPDRDPQSDPNGDPGADADDLVIVPIDDELVADDDGSAGPVSGDTGAPDHAVNDGSSTDEVDIVVLDVDEHPEGPVTGPTEIATAPSTRPAARTRRRGGLAAVIVVPIVLLVVLGALVFLAVRLFATPSYDVPDLVGVEQQQALIEIIDFEWDLQIDTERSDDEPRAGHVIRTVPSAGERLARGEPFLLVVSDGPVLRALPELRDLSLIEAESTLVMLALEPVVGEEHHEVVPEGGVVSWSVTDHPELVAGDEVEPGTEVLVVGSLGPEPRIVPDLSDSDVGDVVTALAQLGLVLDGPDEEFDDDVPVGFVVSQDPPAGTEVERGSSVQVTVSRGPDVVPMPDISELTFPEARAALEEAGLVAVLAFGASDGEFVSATIDGEPAVVGELYRRGTQVDVTYL